MRYLERYLISMKEAMKERTKTLRKIIKSLLLFIHKYLEIVEANLQRDHFTNCDVRNQRQPKRTDVPQEEPKQTSFSKTQRHSYKPTGRRKDGDKKSRDLCSRILRTHTKTIERTSTAERMLTEVEIRGPCCIGNRNSKGH